ncbi:MAG: hypothetical protein OHK0052_09570 [Anaerolineales bacterium]
MILRRIALGMLGLVVAAGVWGYALFSGRADLARGGQVLMAAVGDAPYPLCEVSGWLLTGDVAAVQRAQGWFSQALRNNDALAEAYLLRGQAACLLGDYTAAVTDLGQFTRLQPDNPLGWVELGFALEASGSIDGAVVVWRRAGLNADTFLSEVERLRRERDWARGLRWLRYAENLGTALPSEQAFWGYLAIRSDDTAQALVFLEQAVTLDVGWLNVNSRWDAWRAWGQNLYESGQYQAAREALQYALQIAPVDAIPITFSEAYRFLGLSDWALGDFAAADSALQQAVQVAPNSAWAQVHFTVFRYQTGQFSAQQVQAMFDTVLQENVMNATLWRYTVKFWRDAGNGEIADRYCEMANLKNVIVDGCPVSP